MIASRVGLIVVSAIALLLAIIVGVDIAREDARPSRALVDDFDASKVTRLTWSRPNELDIVIERVGGGKSSGSASTSAPPGNGRSAAPSEGQSAIPSDAPSWRWVAPVSGIAAERSAIDSVFAALRGGRWHRRADAAQAGATQTTLTVTAGTRALTLRVGAALPGTGQTWITIGERAYLVDDWIARALAPAPLALRDTRPLRDAATAEAIVIERPSLLGQPADALRIEGMRMVRPKQLVLEPTNVVALHRALAAMTIVDIPPKTAAKSEIAMVITVAGPPLVTVEMYVHGCLDPQQVAIGGSAGAGCIGPSDYEMIYRSVDGLVRPPAIDLADPRAVPFEPIAITLPDGGVLDLKARPRIGDRDADPGAVTELLAVLQAPIPSIVESDPASKPTATLVATDRGGAQLVVELLATKQLRRRGESVALAPGAGAWAIVTRPASAYRDPRLWSEEPSTIRTIKVKTLIGETTFTRGAVIGEWEGTDKDAAVTAFADLLARLQSTVRGVVMGQGSVSVTFEVAPPAGAAVTRTLHVDMVRCSVRVDGGDQTYVDEKFCAALKPLLP